MFNALREITRRPRPFEFYTADDLWTDEHTSAQMLSYHLNQEVEAASRNAAFIDRSVEWIVSRFSVTAQTRVADFGCGPGLYTSRLARQGARVTGIDFSERSLRFARDAASEAGQSIEYVHQNYLEFDTEARFDLILMIMCDFCALGPRQRRELLQKWRGLLLPGGAVLFDVYSRAAFDARAEAASFGENLLDGFWSPRDYYCFLNTFKYPEDEVMLDKYTIVEAERTRTVYNWLQYYRPESLAEEVSACGFEIEEQWGDVAGAPYDPEFDEFAVILRSR